MSIEERLAEIEARAAHLVKDPRARWMLPLKNAWFFGPCEPMPQPVDLTALVGGTDVPRLVKALRYTFNEWKNATFPDDGYARDHFDKRFGPQVEKILAGEPHA